MGFDRGLGGVANLYDKITITIWLGKHGNLDQQMARITVLGTVEAGFSSTGGRILGIYGVLNGSQSFLRFKLQIW